MPRVRQVSDDLTVLFRDLERRMANLEAATLSRNAQERQVPLLEEVRRTSTQSTVSGNFVNVNWHVSEGPHEGVFWTDNNPSRLTARWDGIYDLSGCIAFQAYGSDNASVNDTHAVRIIRNGDGDDVLKTHAIINGRRNIFGIILPIEKSVRLEEGEYVQLQGFHGLQGLSTSRSYQTGNTMFSMKWAGPYVPSEDLRFLRRIIAQEENGD